MNAQAKSRDFQYWLEHSGAKFVVCDGKDREIAVSLSNLTHKPLCLTIGPSSIEGGVTWSDWLASVDVAATSPQLHAGQSALLIYTSGTTGNPKAVTLSHGNLAANVAAIVEYLALTERDSVVSVLPFYYSYGCSVLHTHLSVGACVVLEQNLVFPHAVVETIARERVTGFSGVPSTYALLLSRVALGKYDLTCLRYLTQAGGAMAPALTMHLQSALPNAQLFVMYGQTEATARLTYLPPGMLNAKLGSVGKPIPGVMIQVRNEQLQLVAPGEVGEVWASGPNIMQGYWRDPAASAAVLHEGWLKTGDMGYLDAEGYLFLSGRRSDMIKAGAHRVHPKEVEEVIAELPVVAEVAVVGVDDDLLGQVIKAFVVSAEGQEVDINAVKAHCRERLAAYKIPKFIDLVASLPKTASGKIRRAELSRS